MTDADISEHTIVGFFLGDFAATPAWPLVVILVTLILNLICGSRIFRFFVMLYPDLEIGDVQIDEDIDNYWASLDEKDREWSIKEDKYSKETLRLQILTNEQSARLNSAEQVIGRTLQGCHSYDILANPLYFDDF